MAQFKPLTVRAANVDSESATAGWSLQAQGDGTSAWAAQSGGGASFIYDGATFAFAEWSDYENVDFTITPTLGGISISDKAWIQIFGWNTGTEQIAPISFSVIGAEFVYQGDETNQISAYVDWSSPPTFHILVVAALAAFRLVMMLPSGSYITSAVQYVPS